MKKVLSLLVCLLLLVGCSTSKDPWGMKLEIKDVTTSIGLTLVSRYDEVEDVKTLTTTSHYKLQSKVKGTWHDIPVKYDTYVFEDETYVLNGEDVEWKLLWSDLYGSLAKGKYRVVKTVECVNANGETSTNEYYAEFAVTDVCRTCLK